MNVAILSKNIRDTLPLLGLVLLGIAGLETLYVWAIGNFATDLVQLWQKIPFLAKAMSTLVGIEISGTVSESALIAMGLVHPLMLAITWSFLITTCTRLTVAESERGTADLLLTLPVTRTRLFLTTTVVWIAGAVLMSLAAWLGVTIGVAILKPAEPVDLLRFLPAITNLLTLSLAVGAGTMFAGTLVSRRGHAVAIVLSVLLLSALINFLAVFNDWFSRLDFLGLLHYYRPVDIVRDHVWPVRNMTVHLLVSAGLFAAAWWRFTRRDVPAV